MRLFATGDIHGTHSIKKLFAENWETGKSLTKEDVVLVAGDLGAVWGNDKEDKDTQDMYEAFPWTTVAVRGNHENYEAINSLSLVEKFGGFVRRVNKSLYFLETGSIYTFGNRTLFAFGGGLSVDKEYRTAFLSWWPQEIPSVTEFNAAFETAKKIKNVDYVLTHAIFQSSFDELPRRFGLSPWNSPKFNDPLLKMLEEIKSVLKYNSWICGHYHIDHYDEDNCVHYLYNEIIELGL